MPTNLRRLLIICLLLAIALVAIVVVPVDNAPAVHVSEPVGIMATDTRLVAVGGKKPVLKRVEALLRHYETRLSSWIDSSAIGRLNAAPADEPLSLDPLAMEVLLHARQAWSDSDGAFDITCGPLIRRWREAAETDRLPTQTELATARRASHWSLLQLDADAGTVRKDAASVVVDLGGIAKGCAIDDAIDALREAGCVGGMVDVGGDLAVFGRSPDGGHWRVAIQDPDGAGSLGTFRMTAGAVCTSGDYRRGRVIAGERYSHIIDPRDDHDGAHPPYHPVRHARSVTVIGPNAMDADLWATALSVLGANGFANLPQGYEALIIRDDGERIQTSGFPDLTPSDADQPDS